MDSQQLSLTDFGNLRQYEMAFFMYMMGQQLCDDMFKQQIITDLINTKEKYDLIITSTFFMDCIYGFQHKLNIPLVQVDFD